MGRAHGNERREAPEERDDALRYQALPRSFFERPVLSVARGLIGALLVHEQPRGRLVGRIVETEAYRGPEDRAAHSFGGRRTSRTEVMYGAAGHAYVFFVYGMHWNFNVVTGGVGQPHAVLIRAVEPLAGQRQMAARRGLPVDSPCLTNGPGKLSQAFGFDRSHYGLDLCAGPVYFAAGEPLAVRRSARVGVPYAREWAERPWRFFAADSPWVSRGPRARGRLPAR